MQINLEPRKHSSRYELKPMSRWWLVLAVVFSSAMALSAGVFNASTWAMFFAGALVTTFSVLCFPKVFLKKDR